MKSSSKQNDFLKLYEPNHDRFERFCRARVYGRMEYGDLMNESLLIAFEKFHTLKSEKSFLSFLIGISIRVLSNDNRKSKEFTTSNQESLNHFVDHSQETDTDADIHFLYLNIGLLSEDQKNCILMFEIAGFNIKEIAVIQNTTESNVKQRLKRGRQKLSELMNFESSFK
jgi:RNA polymerase sigma-70 factor (ECF subfamily)